MDPSRWIAAMDLCHSVPMTRQDTPENCSDSWDVLCGRWLQARGERTRTDDVIVAARKCLASTQDWEWFAQALDDPQRKWFVAEVFRRPPVPKRLRHKMLLAGVLERDPSFNRWFVEPCVRSFGAKWVLEQLLGYLTAGGNAEKAGAANASYWVHENPRHEALSTISDAFQEAALLEFIANDDLDVRRCLIAKLEFQPKDADPRRRKLVDEAIRIATSHHDTYIRRRADIQLGRGGLLMALPRD